MAAVVTLLGTQTFNTNSGTKTVVATPAVGDLIVIVRANTGNTTSHAPTDNNSDGLGVYTLATSALKATSADLMEVWVRRSLVGSASSTTFTDAAGTTSGGGLGVFKITNMTNTGSAAIRQVASQSNQAAATPTPVFSVAALTSNPVIGAVFNATTTAATMTPRGTPAYTEAFDVGYATPTAGLEAMFISSGETGTSIAWGSSSSSAFCSVVVELQFNTPPTVALNTPANAATGQSTTPTLNATATDANSDTVEYNVQVDTANLDGLYTPVNSGDNFDDNSIDTTKWSNWGGGNVQETSSQLQITGSFGNGYYGMDDTPLSIPNGVSMIGKAAFAQVVNAGDLTIVSWEVYPVKLTHVAAGVTDNNSVWWVILTDVTNKIKAFKQVGGVSTAVFVASYNSAVHKWFRIRESGGTTFWDTSADGLTWTNQWSETNPWDLSVCLRDIDVGTWQAEASITTAIFDNANIYPATLIDKVSTTDAGFTAGHPFASGSATDFTVQAGNTLANSTTYYWRERAIDPTGSNSYGAWSAAKTFTTTAGGGVVYSSTRMMMGMGM